MNGVALAGYSCLPLWQSPVFRQHAGSVWSVAWSPNGKLFASGSADKRMFEKFTSVLKER